MPAAASLAFKILASPVWLLWRLYLVLWWAFNEERVPPTAAQRPPEAQRPNAADAGDVAGVLHGPEAGGRATPRTLRFAQQAAFEIVDSTPAAAPKPVGALKGGFAASLILSAAFALLLNSAAHHEIVRNSSVLPLWLWSSCIAFVGSLWPVRHIARRQAAATPKNWRDHTVCIAGGMKDAGVAAYAGALSAKDVSVKAGQRVYSAATRVGEGAGRLWGRVARKTA
jgi:hypothetical protein